MNDHFLADIFVVVRSSDTFPTLLHLTVWDEYYGYIHRNISFSQVFYEIPLDILFFSRWFKKTMDQER